MTLSAVLIAKNEAENITDCLQSVAWADEIIVVDSGSADETISKARQFTAKVYQVPFTDFATQKNAALGRAAGDWVFFIDADERVSKELAGEITEIVRSGRAEYAYAVKRVMYFLGKRLRFSDTQNDTPIRLFPRGRARFDQPVHEQIVTDLPVRRLKHTLVHYSTKDLAHYHAKVRQYVPLEIQILRRKGKNPNILDLILRPIGRFCYLYFWNLGFLDAWAGLQFAALSAYYCFVKYREFIFSPADSCREVLAS